MENFLKAIRVKRLTGKPIEFGRGPDRIAVRHPVEDIDSPRGGVVVKVVPPDLAVGFERGRRRSTDAREIHHVIEAVEVGRVTTIGELIAEDRQVEAVNVRARAHNPCTSASPPR